jgi:hypothetical protein
MEIFLLLTTREFEVMLNNGQKRRFAHDEKARLFQDAKQITDLLDVIIDCRTQELMNGNQRNKH